MSSMHVDPVMTVVRGGAFVGSTYSAGHRAMLGQEVHLSLDIPMSELDSLLVKGFSPSSLPLTTAHSHPPLHELVLKQLTELGNMPDR